MVRSKPAPPFAKFLIGLFLAGWFAGGVGCFFLSVSAAIRQFESSDFSRVPGRILESSVASAPGDEVSRLMVRYAYSVEGEQYVGTVHRHQVVFGPVRPVENLVAEFPPGKAVDVYYDPAAPEDSLLQAGLGAEDFFNFLFAVPFNAIWIFGVMLWWNSRKEDPEIGQRLEDDGETARITTTCFSPAIVAVGTGGLTAAIALGLELLPAAFLGTSHTRPSVALQWGCVLLATVVAYVRQSSFLAAGHREIVVDRKRQTIIVPRERKTQTAERLAIPWLAIRRFEVQEFKERDSFSYRCLIRYSGPDDKRQSAILLDDATRDAAASLATWLQRQVTLADGPKVGFRPAKISERTSDIA